MWTDCSLNATLARNGTECRFGTLNDQQTMAVISGSGYLIYFGCFAATLSSAIASLVGRSHANRHIDSCINLYRYLYTGYMSAHSEGLGSLSNTV
jgi:hypothetical protein